MEEKNKFNGIYQELYNVFGDERLIIEIHKLFWGDAVQFPKYLYSSDYVANIVSKEENIKRRKEIAKSHGYSYDTITKKIRQLNIERN